MRLLTLALVITLLAPAAVHAQDTRPRTAIQVQTADDIGSERFRLADRYFSAGQFDRAIALFEDLRQELPGSNPVFNRLKDSYLGARRYDDALRLVHDQIERTGPTTTLLAEIGSIHVASGDLEAAARAWQRTIEAAPDNVQTYRVLYMVMASNRLWEAARDMLLEGRERLRQPQLFRSELAELYSRTDQFGGALEEWAALLHDDPSRFSFVRGRMGNLLDRADAGESFREALDRLIRRDPTRLTLRRLAAWLTSELGDFETGLDHMRAVDRLGRESGESLFAFAEAALQAGALDQAENAFDIILENHPGSSNAASALLASALLHETRAQNAGENPTGASGAPNAARAAERYNRFLEEYPNHAATPAAMRRLAELRRDLFRDYDRANELLQEVTSRFPDTQEAVEARLALGELAILQNDLPRARAAFTQLETQLRIGERAERARLALAQLDFYEGNFDMALSRTSAMQRNTATDVANNAIELRLILSENQGPDTLSIALRHFARAELLQRQRHHEDALETLDALLASHQGHPITPLARFRRAAALRHLERPAEALAVLDALPRDFPDSYLADRALFAAAEVHERELQDTQAAIEGYMHLLSRFPGSLLAPEARARIRRLRGDLPS